MVEDWTKQQQDWANRGRFEPMGQGRIGNREEYWANMEERLDNGTRDWATGRRGIGPIESRRIGPTGWRGWATGRRR